MLHVSTQKLIIKLCELTEAGGIAWRDGEGQSSVFETEGYLVEIQERPPTVRLLRPDGRELERADEAELAAQPWPDGNGAFAARVSDMAARARRVARGTDLAISRILSSLSAPPRKTPEPEPAAELGPVDQSPPPAPHSMPAPLPEPVETDTAIDRVLAIQPISPPWAEAPPPEPLPEPHVAGSGTTARVIEHARIEQAPAAEAKPEPAPVEAEVVTTAIEPEPTKAVVEAKEDQPPVFEPESAPQPVVATIAETPAPRPQSAFGATSSFSRSGESFPAKITSTGLAFTGYSPTMHQSRRSEPEGQPVPATASRPVQADPPAQEKKPEPAIAGPDIYKPWT